MAYVQGEAEVLVDGFAIDTPNQTPTNTESMYGNYHGYYSKRPVANDPRLAILPKNLFAGATVLDIGCNEGWVTCEIGASLLPPPPDEC